MLNEKQGIEAIIKLQAMAGITETPKQAKKGWNKMSTGEKEQTELAYNSVCK